MSQRILYDATGNVAKYIHVEDPTSHDFHGVFETVQDVEPVLDYIEKARELHDPKAEYRHVATVPDVIYALSLAEGWTEADWNRWLNNGDYAAFRVWGGRMGKGKG